MRNNSAGLGQIGPASAMDDDILRILLLEDSEGDAVLERMAIDESDLGSHSFIRARNLREGLSALSDQPVDIAIVDLGLPDAWGVEVVERLRAIAPALPLVIMTGMEDPAIAQKAMQLGAQDFVRKDQLMSGRLEEAVRFALLRSQAQQFAKTTPAPSPVDNQQELIRLELDAARRMQMGLLPPVDLLRSLSHNYRLDVAGQLEPSLAIGGDLWGTIDLGNGHVAIFAFDFSGHGISAALNTFRLHALIHDHQELALTPHRMLERLDQTLLPLLPRGHYATIFYGVLDLAHDRLTWSAAGSPSPILLESDHKLTPLDGSGFLLGLGANNQRELRQCPFKAGDSLFLYSDAIPESLDRHGDFIGEDGLLELVRNANGESDAQASLTRLLDDFYARANLPIQDDLTALWIRRQPG